MITKDKSHKIKQLKYLLMLPLLTGMLIYTSCKTNPTEQINSSDENILQDTPILSIPGIQMGEYFTIHGFGAPKVIGNVILYKNLSDEEKKEYDQWDKLISNDYITMEIYELKNGEKQIVPRMDENKMKGWAVRGRPNLIENLENTPVFSGCEEGSKEDQKKCSQEKITKYFQQNFNTEITKSLDIESGLKRFMIMFIVDKKGYVADIMVGSNSPEIRREVVRVIHTLPKFTAGMHQGNEVSVMYRMQISIMVI